MSVKSEWRDRASGFFGLSGMKLRSMTQSAGIFVGDVAKDAGTGVAEVAELAAEVAEKAGSAIRERWSLLQKTRKQQAHPLDETVQERFRTAATTTSVLLKRSLQETKEKVAVGKTKFEQAAKRAAERSRSILDRWQKGQSMTNVFGVPLEVLVQHQKSSRPVPQIVVTCVEYLISSGLSTPYIFKSDGDEEVLQHLQFCFEEDSNSVIPEGTNPLDVAALLKGYLKMLPEPLLTFSVYNKIREVGGNIQPLSDLLRTIPYAHYSTLECITSLLQRISQKSVSNKMDARGLASELAPCFLWKQKTRSNINKSGHGFDRSPSSSYAQSSDIQDANTVIPLDDEPSMVDFSIIEAVHCLIEHHNTIFADPIEAIRREFGE